MNKTRLEAFSDGVIAIIITIMVLEMKAPEGVSWEVIKPLIPKLLSYILSFLFVAIYWGNHHHLLHTAKKVTSGIIWSNMNLLFWLSLIPFITAWMGENHFDKVTVASYAVLALVCGLSYNILQSAICKTYDAETSKRINTKQSNWKSIMSVVLYATSIPIALFFNSFIAGSLFFVVSVIWFIPDKNIEKIFAE
ncbi:MAG: hypothetical protein C0459_09190 [Chitinophaga sp.]|jgi:uncharacterized membrane protein|nr:hypothetical protein [Chitinophaga sp.]